MKKYLFIYLIFGSIFSFAQNPLVKMWDYRYGGSGVDWMASIQHTTDGGYILGGFSSSGISGDKSQATWGFYDYWIVKIDSLGIKQWDKDFGGTDDDYLYLVQETSDGGFILGGYSHSGISGDKSQATWGGSADYWIIKTDSLGNKQWDKDFGGTGTDYLLSIQQTSDGGFILGGYSNSGISGDKSEASWGGYDYWIVKTDSLGNKQWDKNFGGADYDCLFSIHQTSDGGFILGGLSESGSSGDKSQPTWGGWDYWIIKTDALGNKLWDKDFGGTSQEDEFGNVTLTSDGGFLLAGTSYSPISGDKSEANLGSEQSWIVKTDSLGNKIWDKTLLTLGHDEIGYAIEANDPGCYLMANNTAGGIGGYKTQDTRGGYDYWIIKFCETLQAGFTSPSFICPGSCIDFTNLSFNATSYQWSFPGALPNTSPAVNPANICYTTPGIYDVQLIATNSNGSDTLLLANYITVYPTPPAQSINQNGDTLFAIAGATTYQWYFNSVIIIGATESFYIAPASGDYNVVATDANGCEVEAAIFNVVASVNAIGDQEILIFPNPVEDKITIHKAQFTSETAMEISIFDVIGEMVMAVLPIAIGMPTAYCLLPTCSFDVSHLPSGIYFLEINTIDDKKIFRAKIIKQ